jgi:hypothetical protein
MNATERKAETYRISKHIFKTEFKLAVIRQVKDDLELFRD